MCVVGIIAVGMANHDMIAKSSAALALAAVSRPRGAAGNHLDDHSIFGGNNILAEGTVDILPVMHSGITGKRVPLSA